jgi:hypothetical protein
VAPLEPQAIAHVYEVGAVLDGRAARRTAQAQVALDPAVQHPLPVAQIAAGDVE